MKKIIDEIKTFFKNNNWKYEYNKEDNIFISGLDMGNVLGNVRMFTPKAVEAPPKPAGP